MKYFIHVHLMPWEIDEFLILVRKLKKAYYYLDKENQYTFYVCLNLSNAIIDWDKSKLEKKFFIDKFHCILEILKNSYNIEWKIYEGDNLFGGMDTEQEVYKRHNEYDAILTICPDVHFHETLLSSVFLAFEAIENKYSIITPQTHRLWDSTWDEITNKQCELLNYNDWNKIDVYDVEWVVENNLDNISLYKVMQYKWAGWFDLKSSKLVASFLPPKSWTVFGPYDTYLMILLSNYKKINSSFDFEQYVIKNQVIGKYSNYNFKTFYKNLLVFEDVKLIQRKKYESEMVMLIQKKIKALQEGDEING